MASAELVMFAIQSGLRMYGATRKAYIDGTVDRPLNLPLVRGAELTEDSAWTWFSTDKTGKEVAALPEHERVRELIAKDDLSRPEKIELIQIYAVLYNEYAVEDFGGIDNPDITGKELGAMLQIRQWSKMAPADHASPLQTVAGTLVNVAVDYFVEMPDAINEKRPEGKALLTFLNTIDDTDFANTSVADIAEDLFLAVIDSVANNPDILSSGEKEQLFIKNVTSSLAASAKELLASDAPSEKKRDASTWLQLVARSVLEEGADTVFSNPVLFLGVKTGAEANVVESVGATLAGLVITDDGVSFRELVSSDGLNTIVESSLSAIVSNPGILKTDEAGLKKIILAVAETLTVQEDVVTKDAFPELVRLILEKTAGNLELVWEGETSDPQRNLLIAASRELLQAISENKDGAWSPDLTKQELLEVAETILDGVIDNPDWLVTDIAGDNTVIREALDAAFASLKRQDGKRLNKDTLIMALETSVEAVAMNLSLLQKLPDAGGDGGKAVLTAALDAVFDSVFARDVEAAAKWQLARNSAIQMMVEVVLEELPGKAVDQANIDIIRATIGEVVDGTLALDRFPLALEDRLNSGLS